MEEQKNKPKLDDLRVDSFVTSGEIDLRTVRGGSQSNLLMCHDDPYNPGDTADARFCG